MPKKIIHQSEKRFNELKKAEGIDLIPQPKRFRIGPTTYTPDFYSPSEGIFYEVVGKSQSFRANLLKYMEFFKLYPDKKIQFVRPDGTIYIEAEKIGQRSPKKPCNFLYFAMRLDPRTKERIFQLAKIDGRTPSAYARKILDAHIAQLFNS